LLICVGWIDDFTAVIGGGITAAGEFVGGTIASVPAMVEGAVDYVSNMTLDDWMDAGQLGLDGKHIGTEHETEVFVFSLVRV